MPCHDNNLLGEYRSKLVSGNLLRISMKYLNPKQICWQGKLVTKLIEVCKYFWHNLIHRGLSKHWNNATLVFELKTLELTQSPHFLDKSNKSTNLPLPRFMTPPPTPDSKWIFPTNFPSNLCLNWIIKIICFQDCWHRSYKIKSCNLLTLLLV